MSACLSERKFSPLIQITSTAPAATPASFSLSTWLTASTVSASGTRLSVTP